jgi:hypothetical protein
MAVTITHVFLWGSSATNHIEKALMGSPCCGLGLMRLQKKIACGSPGLLLFFAFLYIPAQAHASYHRSFNRFIDTSII